MSSPEVERFEVTDEDLANEFNPNRPTYRQSKNKAIYGKFVLVVQCFVTHSVHGVDPYDQIMMIFVDGETEDELTNQHRLKVFKLILLASSTSGPPSTGKQFVLK